jgi:hypothetical protein
MEYGKVLLTFPKKEALGILVFDVSTVTGAFAGQRRGHDDHGCLEILNHRYCDDGRHHDRNRRIFD